MSSNEHTGARLVTKPPTKEYQKNLDIVFSPRPLRRIVFGGDEQDKANEYLREQGEKFTNYEFVLSFELGNIVIYSNKIK